LSCIKKYDSISVRLKVFFYGGNCNSKKKKVTKDAEILILF
jgi:hypothetical protein